MKFKKNLKQKFRDLEFWLFQRKLAWKKGHFSNFNEQKIIHKYISQLNIGEQSRTVVDIGAGNGVRMSNTYDLFINGWRGVGIEYHSRKAAQLAYAYKFHPNAAVSRCLVTPHNVVSLLQAHSIETDFGILSLDIDSYDYWVLDALLSVFRPRLIVSEYNENIPPPIKFAVDYDPHFQLYNHFFGYSLAQLNDLLIKHNYALLEIEYNNVFLAPAELPNTKSMGIEEAYKQGYLERADRHEKFKDNSDMEILQTLTPEKGIEFINQFFSKHEGKYQINLD